MAEQKIYPKGITAFAKNDKQPDFVKGSIIITPKDLNEWLNGLGKDFLVDGKYGKQLKLQITEWQGKLSLSVDTWKPTVNNTDKASTTTPMNDPDLVDDPSNSLSF